MYCYIKHDIFSSPCLIGLGYAGDDGRRGGAAQGAGNNAAQANPQAGDSSQGIDAAAGVAQVQPQIIPSMTGGDSGDYEAGNQVNMQGYIPPQSGGGAQTGAVGYIPPQSGGAAAAGAAAAGDSSNSVDSPLAGANNVAPNAGAVAGGADAGLSLHRQDLRESSGMSGAAVAGVVAGVVAVGAVGTAVAVVALKSAASPLSPA